MSEKFCYNVNDHFKHIYSAHPDAYFQMFLKLNVLKNGRTVVDVTGFDEKESSFMGSDLVSD